MDWGGIIASAMGGGAQAIGQMADHSMQQRDLEAREKRSEQRAIEGEQRRAQLNFDMASKEADRKMQLYMESYDKVEKRAKEIGTERDVKSLQLPEELAGPQVNAEVVDRFSPQQRAMMEKSGQLQKQTGSGIIADKIAAARDIGADPALRKDLGDEYKQQIGIEREQTRNENAQRSLDQKDAAQADRERRTDALFAKIAGGGSGSKGDTDQWLKLIAEQRKGYKDDLAQLRSDKAAAIAAEPNPKKKQEIIARFDEKLTSLQGKSDAIDSKIEAVTERLLGKPGAPEVKKKDAAQQLNDIPKDAKQIGTSGGKPVYETPDGKRYIRK